MSIVPGTRLTGTLPGEDLVSAGIADLAGGRETVESLLVSIGGPRLSALGIELPPTFANPEERLFARLERDHSADAHSQYNALIRTLVSFERAAESLT